MYIRYVRTCVFVQMYLYVRMYVRTYVHMNLCTYIRTLCCHRGTIVSTYVCTLCHIMLVVLELSKVCEVVGF